MVVTKGQRAVISVAGHEIEVFMLPNGEYRFSNTSVATAINVNRTDAAKYIERTNPDASEGSMLIQVGSARIKGLTEVAVAQYWQWKAQNGNKVALALVTALNAEALTRRADAAFGQTKTEEQYETQTRVRMDLILEYMKGYKPFINGKRQWIDSIEGFTTVEVKVAGKLAYIAEKEYQLADPELTTSERELLLERIADAREEIATM